MGTMWQFGLKTLLLLTLLAAMACAVVFVIPIRIGLLTLVVATLALAAPMVTGVVFGGGYGRAFALGALSGYVAWIFAGIPVAFIVVTAFNGSPFDSATNVFALLTNDSEAANALRYFVSCWPLVAVAGLLGMAVRWRSLR